MLSSSKVEKGVDFVSTPSVFVHHTTPLVERATTSHIGDNKHTPNCGKCWFAFLFLNTVSFSSVA
jgi:hypothetical protein